jgi:AcrR family transcriptional regulator
VTGRATAGRPVGLPIASRPRGLGGAKVSSQPSRPAAAPQRPVRAARREAVRNYHRILHAAREVLGESGAEAGMEEIAARAGVGVGTVYRRFASKDALIGELLRLALDELLAAVDRALARADGHGLEELLRAFGPSFADHARYANLFLGRPGNAAATLRIQEALAELTRRAVAAGTVNPGVTSGDVMALVLAMRGLVQAQGDMDPAAWQRFLDIHLAGLRAAGTPGRPPAAFPWSRPGD